MRFLIHAIPEREENVAKIMASHALSCCKDIELCIYTDDEHEGNLPAYLKSITFMMEANDISDQELVWHLQDDVLLLPNFWERCKAYGKTYEKDMYEIPEYDIFCGFTSSADYIPDRGWKAAAIGVLPEAMFYSFPCIGIPLWVSIEFAKWVRDESVHTAQELNWIWNKKYDDSLFQNYICSRWDKELDGKLCIHNLPKCLVDHRDDLCGGSVVNPTATPNGRRARLK